MVIQFAPQPMIKPGRCRGCGVKLTVLQVRRGLCDAPECRRKDVAYQEDLRRQSTLQRVRESLPESWPPNAAIALLPRNQQSLIPLSRKRIQAHRRHLEQVVRQAREQREADESIATETRATTSGVSPGQATLPVLGSICGLCGGHCCNTGGNAAWLEPATIVRRQREAPDLNEDSIVETYLSYLPEISHENSCIYHAENGCCLPRNIRSNVCNQYLCRGLGEVVSALDSTFSVCVAASMTGSEISQVALIDAQGILEKLKPEQPDE